MELQEALARNLVAVISVTGGLIWLIAMTLGDYWAKARKAETEANLKKTMIEQGFSADEIVRVLSTKGSSSAKSCRKNPDNARVE